MKIVNSAPDMNDAITRMEDATRENAGILYLLAVAAMQCDAPGPNDEQADALITVASNMGSRLSEALDAVGKAAAAANPAANSAPAGRRAMPAASRGQLRAVG